MPAWQTDGNPDADIGANSFLGTRANDPLRFRTYAGPNNPGLNIDRMVVTPGGNVGIGTSNPDPGAKLTVAGGGAQVNGVAVGTDVPGINYPFEYETVGVTNPAFNLRLQSPNWIIFHTGGAAPTDRMSIAPGGNVGIGTTGPPAGKLDVRGDIRAGNSDIYFTEPNHNHTGIGNTAGFAAIENAVNYGALMILGRAGTTRGRMVRLWDYLQVNGGMDVTGNVEFLTASNSIRVSSAWTAFPDSVTNRAEISNDTGTYRTLMIVGNRSAGLGRRVSVWDRLEVNGNLHVTGTATKPGGGPWGVGSDIRLKKNVKPLKGALGKLLRLRGIRFEWKEPEKQGNLVGPQLGLVAQEVEEVFPEWVDTDPSGYKILTVRGFEALTIEAFRELKSENETLKLKNEELEDRIKVLELPISERQPSGSRNGAVR
jgi:hypothetical protein